MLEKAHAGNAVDCHVARSGLTPQYEQLEEQVQKVPADRGLCALIPCNHFWSKEPGASDEEISTATLHAVGGDRAPMFSKD